VEVLARPSLCAVILLSDDLRAEMTREQFGLRLRSLLEVTVVTARDRIRILSRGDTDAIGDAGSRRMR
jgi:hypothetical protein